MRYLHKNIIHYYLKLGINFIERNLYLIEIVILFSCIPTYLLDMNYEAIIVK